MGNLQPRQPIQWAVNSYQSESLALSGQRLVNMYAEKQPEDAKSPVALMPCPGIATVATHTGHQWDAFVVMAGTIYGCAAGDLLRLNPDSTLTNLGSYAEGVTPVSMATSGQQIVIVNGLQGYVYTPDDGLVQITDPDFAPASTVTFQDGYFIFTTNDESGQWFISNLFDGGDYDALDFATAEGSPDPLVAALSHHRELWLFGTKTIEIWWNSGDATFPFERQQGSYIERGCGAAQSVCQQDNTVFWLGDDGIVYRAADYSPARISTHAIELAIDRMERFDDARGWSYTQFGHMFYVLTFPSGNETFIYDVSTGLWHERLEWQYGSTFGWSRWLVNAAISHNGKVYVGDLMGNLGTIDVDTMTYSGRMIRRLMTSPTLHLQQEHLAITRLQVDFQAGMGLVTGQGEDPQAMLRWSNDGGYTWSNEHWTPLGKMGNYQARAVWRRLGTIQKGRVFECSVSDPVRVIVMGAYADLVTR